MGCSGVCSRFSNSSLWSSIVLVVYSSILIVNSVLDPVRLLSVVDFVLIDLYGLCVRFDFSLDVGWAAYSVYLVFRSIRRGPACIVCLLSGREIGQGRKAHYVFSERAGAEEHDQKNQAPAETRTSERRSPNAHFHVRSSFFSRTSCIKTMKVERISESHVSPSR